MLMATVADWLPFVFAKPILNTSGQLTIRDCWRKLVAGERNQLNLLLCAAA